MIEKIDYRFKILYALGMIFIVAGHCNYGGISIVYDWFTPYAFHLGLFIFSSGYFFKINNQDNIIQYILKKIKKLIIPLYLWNIFYAVLIMILSYAGFSMGTPVTLYKLIVSPIIDGHQFLYNLGGWFVIPLFMVQIYSLVIRRLINYLHIQLNEYIYFILAVLLGMTGIYIASQGYNTDWWLVLVRLLYFIPFYEMGILYKYKLEKYDHLSNYYYFAILFLVQLIIILKYQRLVSYTPSWCNDFTDGIFLPFLIGFIGIAFWLRVARILEPILKDSKIMNLIANNTYTIMINHFLGFMIVKTLFAIGNRYLGLFVGFDWINYKNNIWYYYLPKNINQVYIIYLVAGLLIPICIQTFIDKGKKNVMKIIKSHI